jgi:phosphopantetheine adenylyltransferase
MDSFRYFIESAVAIKDVNTNPQREKMVVVMGRFQPPTLAHRDIIIDASKKFKAPVAIVLVRGEKTPKEKSPFPIEMQKVMLNKMIKVPHDIYITGSGFIGNFISMMRDNGKEPIGLVAGTDRIKTYKGQIKRYGDEFNLNMKVKEIKRGAQDISATKVRNALKNDDIETFKKMTDKNIWNLFDKLKGYVK